MVKYVGERSNKRNLLQHLRSVPSVLQHLSLQRHDRRVSLLLSADPNTLRPEVWDALWNFSFSTEFDESRQLAHRLRLVNASLNAPQRTRVLSIDPANPANSTVLRAFLTKNPPTLEDLRVLPPGIYSKDFSRTLLELVSDLDVDCEKFDLIFPRLDPDKAAPTALAISPRDCVSDDHVVRYFTDSDERANVELSNIVLLLERRPHLVTELIKHSRHRGVLLTIASSRFLTSPDDQYALVTHRALNEPQPTTTRNQRRADSLRIARALLANPCLHPSAVRRAYETVQENIVTAHHETPVDWTLLQPAQAARAEALAATRYEEVSDLDLLDELIASVSKKDAHNAQSDQRALEANVHLTDSLREFLSGPTSVRRVVSSRAPVTNGHNHRVLFGSMPVSVLTDEVYFDVLESAMTDLLGDDASAWETFLELLNTAPDRATFISVAAAAKFANLANTL